MSTVETLRRARDDSAFPGKLVFSVQARPGVQEGRLLLDNDGTPLFRRGKYRTTTLGQVRLKADNPAQCLAESPIPGNDFHCNIVGLTPEDFESILSSPPKQNPVPPAGE